MIILLDLSKVFYLKYISKRLPFEFKAENIQPKIFLAIKNLDNYPQKNYFRISMITMMILCLKTMETTSMAQGVESKP